jgi:hypothetical protein
MVLRGFKMALSLLEDLCASYDYAEIHIDMS